MFGYVSFFVRIFPPGRIFYWKPHAPRARTASTTGCVSLRPKDVELVCCWLPTGSLAVRTPLLNVHCHADSLPERIPLRLHSLSPAVIHQTISWLGNMNRSTATDESRAVGGLGTCLLHAVGTSSFLAVCSIHGWQAYRMYKVGWPRSSICRGWNRTDDWISVASRCGIILGAYACCS
jgi:hypothetical protein